MLKQSILVALAVVAVAASAQNATPDAWTGEPQAALSRVEPTAVRSGGEVARDAKPRPRRPRRSH